MNAGAAIVGHQNRVVRRFLEAEATDAQHSRTPGELGVREALVFRGLVRRGVLVESAPGRYHVDVESAAGLQQRRRLLALLMLVAVALLALGLLWRRG